ncbi:MAG: peroxide stress protein YaaA [Granulosicoccus sp.]|nr:peroxide stress protein YaaA [Granulosicoccus sp.]
MLILISPAKTLDYDSPLAVKKFTQPEFMAQSQELIDQLSRFTPKRVAGLMNLSDKLAALNVDRYRSWQQPFEPGAARQSIYAFRGDVYIGLDADSLSTRDLTYAQKHLRILSGLHGVLRPLDLIQPHRLEMGTALKNRRGKDLYAYWRDTVTESLNTQLSSAKSLVVNLASQEYFKAVDRNNIEGRVITPIFKDLKMPAADESSSSRTMRRSNNDYKIISFFAKKARGRMARYLIDQRVKTISGIKAFTIDGYQWNEALSDGDELVFTRDAAPS